MAGCASAAFDLNDDGNDLYERGEYADALESYRRAQALEPDRGQLNYNAGNALHRLELYDQAVQETLRALPADDPSLAARAHYSLGNHYFRLGRLSEALDEYKQTLLLDPNDEDAKYNLEVVQRQIAIQPLVGEQPAGDDGMRDGARPRPGGEGPASEGIPGLPPGEEPPTGEPSDRQEILRELSEALAGIGEELTIAEALRVLDLIQERSRPQPADTAASEGEPGGPPDY
jgi:tetratricopeptide (TPR) repeat protein